MKNLIMYNVSSEVGCTIGVRTPIHAHYKSKRQYFGNTLRESIYEKFSRDFTKPLFCSNGSCWDYNFGYSGSPHARPCQIKTAAHLLTHFCAADDGKHPILVCPFVRCTAFLTCLKAPANWFNITYDYTLKYPSKPFKKSGGGNNRSKRSNGNSNQ